MKDKQWIPRWADQVFLENGQYRVVVGEKEYFIPQNQLSELSGKDSWALDTDKGQIWFRKDDTMLG